MKLKVMHVPRGYDGLHIEVPGALVNIYIGLCDEHGAVTRVSVSADGRRYAGGDGSQGGTEGWIKPGSSISPEGAGIMIGCYPAGKVYGKTNPERIKMAELGHRCHKVST
jgi:hypothetical protein